MKNLILETNSKKCSQNKVEYDKVVKTADSKNKFKIHTDKKSFSNTFE
jgi:hypothetical protein